MQEMTRRLGQEKTGTLLFKLSLPATAGMFLNALYNIVDAYFLGNYVSATAIGAMAIAFPIQMLALGTGQMIGIGSASVISRNFGSGNSEKAFKTAGNAISSVLIFGLLYSLTGLLFINPILKAFGATSEILPFAYDYMSIIFPGSIFFIFIVCNNNIIRSEGNAKVAMISMLTGAGLNIILDYVFIRVFEMGIKGAAYATIISQFIAFLYIIGYLISGKSSLKLKFRHFIIDIKILIEAVTIGIASFVRTISTSIVVLAINNMLKIYGGTDAITVLGIVNRIAMFIILPLIGITQGMQPIVGYNYGAKNITRVKNTVYTAVKYICIIATFTFTLSILFPEKIIDIFTDEANLIKEGTRVFKINILMVPILGIQIVGAAFYQSIGKAGKALLLALLRQAFILTPLVLILPGLFGLGVNGVWYSFPVADFISTAITAIILYKGIKSIEKIYGKKSVINDK
jgi:putative MATE family efflux protein